MLPANIDYPVRVDIDYSAEHNRLTTFFRFLLVIPHYVALVFVGIAAFFVVVIAWFATLFTGRYPRSLFDFLAGVIRWSLRVAAYNLLLTDRYPPFSLADDPDYPVRVTFDHPEHIARWRPLVNWILVLPFAYAAGAVLYAAYFVSIAAWFMVVFTGRYPDGMFSFMGVALRWTARQQVFQLWMTERYPPFEWA
jgi:uncharacterized membrane protein